MIKKGKAILYHGATLEAATTLGTMATKILVLAT